MTGFTTDGGLLFVLTLIYWGLLAWLAFRRFSRGRALLIAIVLAPFGGFALAVITFLVIVLAIPS